MITASIKDDLRSFRRSWIHHTGMQLATTTVLAATFSVVVFVLAMSFNLKRVVGSWGEGVQLTAYLLEGTSEDRVSTLRQSIEALSEVNSIEYIPREVATRNFKTQMASYAPGLLNDADFHNPFPASFRIGLKDGVVNQADVDRLETLAKSIQGMEGIEDVAYGQNWLRTYSSATSTGAAIMGTLILIMLGGSLLVIGNSIRASISARKEEIEILELVGATESMIRRPYVVEGFLMGAVSSAFALIVNYLVHVWQVNAMSTSLVLGRMAAFVKFPNLFWCVAFIFCGAFVGALGSWLTVRKINDGWSAAQKAQS
jgi:cell division transport system permease protein